MSRSQISETSVYDQPKRNAYAGVEAEKTKEEADFYKIKSKELESRNEHLIKINEELRSKIQGVLKVKQTSAASEFFKEQNRYLES